ncbi:MAG: hypothetical protein N4R05_05105 [Lactobacillus iners]|nr:hypothetical protein [Lactobacillus iners]
MEIYKGNAMIFSEEIKQIRTHCFLYRKIFKEHYIDYSNIEDKYLNDKVGGRRMVDTKDEDIDDEMVWDINREKAMMAPQRIKLVTKYILEHFDQKTYRGYKTYAYNTLMNVAKVVSSDRGAVEEIKKK